MLQMAETAGSALGGPPHEEGQAAGAVVAQGVEDLGHLERGVADVDEAHGIGREVAHGPSLGVPLLGASEYGGRHE